MNDMVLLIEPLIPAMRRYACAFLRDRSAADDLVQDCLERAIGRWHQRRADGNPRTWIFTILHNLAVNHVNQARRRGKFVPLEDADEAALSQPASQDGALRHRDLLKALADLPEDQRSTVLLVSVEGLSYAEAASVLDIPIGTIMSRLARGRERLRRAVEGEADAARAPNIRRIK
ncbi:MAG TPA: sigma-70 family RNA polymerase sigma factor [Stellaceae bacterium]|nr:sigma-70 family RNA polymerase sigma factor [Stellaceae bacterium]